MRARRRNPFEPLEDEITEAVVAHWRFFGVPGSLVASIPLKRAFGQAGLTPGLPDLLVLSPTLGDRTGFMELKRERGGRLSDAQLVMRELFLMRRAPYAVCYGRDEPIERLEKWGAVRPQKAAPTTRDFRDTVKARAERDPEFRDALRQSEGEP